MANFSTPQLWQWLMDAFFQHDTYTPWTSLLVGLVTTTPNPSSNPSSGPIGEPPTSAAYARQSYPINTASWTRAADGITMSNATAITFPVPSAKWGVITHVVTIDANGNMILTAHQLQTPLKVLAGATAPTIGVGELVIRPHG